MSLQLPHSTFWWRWLLVGLAAGAVAGTLLRTLLTLTASLQHPVLDRSGLGSNSWAVVFPANLLSAKFIVSLIVLGGVYGVCQSIAQWLALREQTPKRRRALQAHFVATILGTVLVGVLSFWLFAVGFAAWLTSLGLSIPQIVVLAVFIVGGFGGIAQAIVQRGLLHNVAQASYLRWIVPLALLGHLSGAVVGLFAIPLIT